MLFSVANLEHTKMFINTKLWPYVLITVSFFVYLFFFHPQIFRYKIPTTLVHDYLRSQDIEDPKGLIHDRIYLSDSDIYIGSGYLYATGSDPSSLNLHPPLIKYLFGFSTFLTGNPFLVQILFGLGLLMLTYFLGTKLFRSPLAALGAVFFMMLDPVFAGMMDWALLDLGQAFFALGYLVSLFFFPGSWVLSGVALGLFASSKFWTTAVIFTVLVYAYKFIIRKEKPNFRGIGLSFLMGLTVFSLTYIVSFVNAGGMFNILEYQGRVLRFMLTHNSAASIGGPIILFLTGNFIPWWGTGGILRAPDWSLLWPMGLVSGIILSVRTKLGDLKAFFYLVPCAYLLLSITQVPFTRYFIIILPFIYLSFANFLVQWYHSPHVPRKT